MEYSYDVQSTGMGAGGIIVMLIFYVFFAFCLAKIAQKTGREFGASFIMALIPIANIILMLQVAGKPWWWLFLGFIPIVNLVIWIIVWMNIAEARGKPAWWGVVIILVPFVNLVMFLMLAFGKEAVKVAPPSMPTEA